MGQLEDIQVFIRVVESGGIGKAAEQLNLAKSAVSRRLADLESRLETKLIQRTTRKSSLTDAGQLYYQRALNVMDAVTEMNQVTREQKNNLEGNLRLALPLSFGLEHLSPLLDEFASQHPKLTMQIDFSDREVDLVEEGFDVAFRITDLKDSTIQARKITPIRFVLCASPAYLEEHGVPKTASELKQHQVLRYGSKTAMSWVLVGPDGQEHHLNLDGRLFSNNGHFLLNMAKSGHGIVLQPTFIAWKALAKGELVPIMTDYEIPPVAAYAVYPQNRFLSQKARTLIDFLVERFGNNAYWDQL